VTAFATAWIELLATLGLYEARVLPAVRRELESWRLAAAGIPDPELRRGAIAALTDKAANPEATAVFTTLAARPHRAAVLRASTALQVAVDYLDSLGEQATADPLRDGLQLHGALAAALTPGAGPGDWYRDHSAGEDGGYLDRLVGACQEAVASLPAGDRVLPAARRAATRCGEGQSHTHAAASEGERALEAWAAGQPAAGSFRWWEVAAGASSSIAAHALIALAADPAASAADAEAVDTAYLSSIGALTVLLDDLVDREADEASGDHNYMHFYADAEEAALRLEGLARNAGAAILGLPRSRRHATILSGVLAFYLSSAGARTAYAGPVRARLLASSDTTLRLLTALLGFRYRG
jgi:tetraprenyl-beta-curcumene synthase